MSNSSDSSSGSISIQFLHVMPLQFPHAAMHLTSIFLQLHLRLLQSPFAGIIKPETLPPTDGAATQHSLRAYLQTQDWILLQSMSLDPTNYGWAIGAHGFEPIPMLEPIAPEELLKFTSCNCLPREHAVPDCT